jgi:hypothetical protein
MTGDRRQAIVERYLDSGRAGGRGRLRIFRDDACTRLAS